MFGDANCCEKLSWGLGCQAGLHTNSATKQAYIQTWPSMNLHRLGRQTGLHRPSCQTGLHRLGRIMGPHTLGCRTGLHTHWPPKGPTNTWQPDGPTHTWLPDGPTHTLANKGAYTYHPPNRHTHSTFIHHMGNYGATAYYQEQIALQCQ